jgi:hypothetical protein
MQRASSENNEKIAAFLWIASVEIVQLEIAELFPLLGSMELDTDISTTRLIRSRT